MEPYGVMSDEQQDSSFKINPKHKGWCTPMSKKTCTGKRRQFALNAKKSHGFRKKSK
jgi:hypothetical protein